MIMDECIFCKIASGAIQATKVYEDADFVAFLDLHPTQPGHTLVIPKKHFEKFELTPPEVVGALFQVARQIAPAIAQAMDATSFNVSVNNGPAAGQIIFHTHVHIIPRKSNDGLAPWGHRDYQDNERDEIAKKIRAAINH